MKILMILESEFPPDIRVENEITSLTEAGHEIHLACMTKKNRPAFEKWGRTTIFRKSVSTFIYKSSVGALKFPFYFNFWRKYIHELFTRESYDAVHIHDLPLCRIGAEIKERYKIPFIIDLHENWPGLLSISLHTKTIPGRLICNIRQWENYEKEYTGSADRIIVVVREARDRLMKLSVPEEKITIVSNTLKLGNLITDHNKTDKNPGKKIIIYEGGLTFHRGVQYVLKALAKIRSVSPEIEFWIVGTGNYMKDLELLSDQMQLYKIVKFFGWQPQEKVHELINKADIAVIPHIKSSHTDATVPHKLFHYMYAGLPILASDCEPVKRIINETSCGYTYQYDDIDELATRIISLINSGSSTQTNGKDWVIRKYNWSFEEKQLTGIYEKLSPETSCI